MNFFEKIVRRLLKESRTINSEWWITDNGTQYADGNIGDYNHEMLAAQEATRMILGHIPDFHFESDELPCYLSYLEENSKDDYDNLMDILIANKMGIEVSDLKDMENYEDIVYSHNLEDLIIAYFQKNPNPKIDESTINVAFDKQDPRDWAMKKLGWVRFAGGWFQSWNLSPETFSRIVSGADDILDQEGIGEDEEDDIKFSIELRATNRTFSDIPYSVLKRKNIKELIPYRDR